MRWVKVGVEARGDASQPFEERVCGSVEELVGDAEDPMSADGFERLPVASLDDPFQWNAIPCPAPTEDQDVRIFGSDVFWRGVGAWCAKVAPASCFDEFGDPGLRVNEGFAPLFAVNDWGFGAALAPLARGIEGGLHFGDEGIAFRLRIDHSGNEADVFIDVSK